MRTTGVDLMGQKFAHQTVIGITNKRGNGHIVWKCQCDCGRINDFNQSFIKHNGGIVSCGKKCKWTIRGNLRGRVYYGIWMNIISRCYNSKDAAFKNYGAKGIGMCDEWRNDYWSFHKWMNDNGWKRGLQVDRYPNMLGNYEPSNCRIATQKMQLNNKTNNVVYEINGIRKNVSEWCVFYNIKPNTVFTRLFRGWDIIPALTISTSKNKMRSTLIKKEERFTT